MGRNGESGMLIWGKEEEGLRRRPNGKRLLGDSQGDCLRWGVGGRRGGTHFKSVKEGEMKKMAKKTNKPKVQEEGLVESLER